MKTKFTILMFSLLLAVGWTCGASAQSLPKGLKAQKKLSIPTSITSANTGTGAMMNAPKQEPTRDEQVSRVVKPKSYYQQFKYNWTDEETGETHTNVDPTEPARNPYQIYELIRFVYGNPNFPGPSYSAYKPNFEREDPVYYGDIAGGWNLTKVTSGGASVTTYDITISTSSYYPSITDITVYDLNDNVLTSWNAATAVANGAYTTFTSSGTTYADFTLPTGWTKDFDHFVAINIGTENSPVYAAYTATGTTSGGTITIPYSLLNGQTEVKVVINANHDWVTGDEGSSTQTLTVGSNTSESKTLTSDLADYTWNNVVVAVQPEQGAYVQGTVVTPYEDGYTVLVVALNNDITKVAEHSTYDSSQFTDKADLITYIKNNIEFVKLLTDGLRVGEESNHTSGTIFNCDGRYNKFFFLGKGQARKKAESVLSRINSGTWISYCGEDVPFEEMFEQFSPTSTKLDESSQTVDFFDRLREGNVYNLLHDCPSVIQTGHQFSLAGNSGTDYYAFSGLNFFIPDYRLLWWQGTDSSYPNVVVDGRDTDPYQRSNATTGAHGTAYRNVSNTGYYYWSSYYTNYNQNFAPVVGIYRITLAATATQTGNSHDPNNLNYDVTLTWVSSLDEMTGHKVDQIYTVYLVDENGNRTELHPESVTFYDANGNALTGDYSGNPFVVTQVVYKVPQNEHSYTIEYQVDGVAQQGPAFHATSNTASVVIPGWNDFVGLQLDHHESDFVITSETVRHNWYRNFLAMVNEDIYNGLTISKITGYNPNGEQNTPMNKFNLYRYTYDENGEPKDYFKVATITFDQATADQVHYTITYENQEIEPYNFTYTEGTGTNAQTVTVNDAYELETMEIPTSGWVRVKGNGDIVIWPNRYSVNIKSITIKNGNTTVASWNASSANVATQSAGLPTTPYKWGTSPGSKFLPYVTSDNEKVCYMEGGGYLYIPGILNDYPNATVTIEAFGEAGNVNRISVNDASQDITATSGGTTYTWGGSDNPVSPNAAPRVDGGNKPMLKPYRSNIDSKIKMREVKKANNN